LDFLGFFGALKKGKPEDPKKLPQRAGKLTGQLSSDQWSPGRNCDAVKAFEYLQIQPRPAAETAFGGPFYVT
jgi:hypothetical protein